MNSPGSGILSGFTKLCKGLTVPVILIGSHIVVQLLPISVTYLALIPARCFNKHLEDNGDILDRQLSVSNDTIKDGRAKDEKYKNDKYKDTCREELNCEDKCQIDKLRDDRSASDQANNSEESGNVIESRIWDALETVKTSHLLHASASSSNNIVPAGNSTANCSK